MKRSPYYMDPPSISEPVRSSLFDGSPRGIAEQLNRCVKNLAHHYRYQAPARKEAILNAIYLLDKQVSVRSLKPLRGPEDGSQGVQ